MQCESEIANFTGSSEHWSAVELTAGDRARDIAELDDRSGDALRERESNDQRADQRDDAGDQDITARAGDDLAKLCCRNREPNHAEWVFDREIHLIVAG